MQPWLLQLVHRGTLMLRVHQRRLAIALMRRSQLRYGLPCREASQQQRGLRHRHGLAEQLALRLGAAFFLELLELLCGLEALGGRLHAKAAAQGRDGADDRKRLRTLTLGKIVHG